jgi:hypothetical protein
MENERIRTQTEYLKLIGVMSHEDWINEYLVYQTYGPKATLLAMFRSLARDADSLPAPCEKGEILRILEKNKHLIMNNGRRVFALVTTENRKLVVLAAHIGYYRENYSTIIGKITYKEYDPFSFNMLWFLESGHKVIARAS